MHSTKHPPGSSSALSEDLCRNQNVGSQEEEEYSVTENRPASKTAMKRRKPESPCILRCLTPDPPPLLPRVLPVDDASVYMAVFRPWASDTLSPWHVPPPASGRRTLGSTSHRCCTSSWACRHRCRRLGGLMAAHRGGFNQWCVCV